MLVYDGLICAFSMSFTFETVNSVHRKVTLSDKRAFTPLLTKWFGRMRIGDIGFQME